MISSIQATSAPTFKVLDDPNGAKAECKLIIVRACINILLFEKNSSYTICSKYIRLEMIHQVMKERTLVIFLDWINNHVEAFAYELEGAYISFIMVVSKACNRAV